MRLKLSTVIFRAFMLAVFLTGMLALAARFGDGPTGPFPGGPLRAGKLIESEIASWKFVNNVRWVELQTADPTVSRRTWVLYHRGDLYVPCFLPRYKSWPHDVLINEDVVLRILGKRYKRRARRVTNPKLVRDLDHDMYQKYGASWVDVQDDSKIWFFKMHAPSK